MILSAMCNNNWNEHWTQLKDEYIVGDKILKNERLDYILDQNNA